MKKHYNLYYLFLEDKLCHRMPEKRRNKIRSALEKFYKTLKPPHKKRLSATKKIFKNYPEK